MYYGGVPQGTPDPDPTSQSRPQGAFPGFGGGALTSKSEKIALGTRL